MVMKRKAAFLNFEGTPLQFDAVLAETTTHTASVTEHPVEEGANVSDHVRDELDSIELQILVSNTPVKDVNNMYNGSVAGLELKVPKFEPPLSPMPGALMSAGLDALKGALAGKTDQKALVLQFPEAFNNCSFILGTLLDWKERGVVGQVITGDRTYPSVVITNVTTKRTSTTGDALEISLELREIRIVESKMITAPIPTETRGNVSKPKGRQPTSFARDPGPKKSLLTKLKDGLLGD